MMQTTHSPDRGHSTATSILTLLVLLTWCAIGSAKDASTKLGIFDRSHTKDVICGEVGAISCGQTVSGRLDSSEDCEAGDGTYFDVWEFPGSNGDDVRIDLRSNQFDTFMALVTPTGAVATTDDDSGNGLNSRIEFTLNQNGNWEIIANGFAPDDLGNYNLQLTCPGQGGGGGGGDFTVNKDTSGSWFPPELDGQGWKIEILDDDTALLYWFTYPPQGQQASMGDQAWMIGVGQIDGDTITFDLVLPTGPTFGPDFNPADVVPNEWGSFMIRFTGPNEAEAEYNGSMAGFGAGEFPDIQRLTSIAANTEQQKMGMATNMGPGISGSWFDPSHDGEGWTIEVIDEDTVLVYWFTYDENGNQAWNIGVGKLVGNKVFVDFPVETTGTAFGAGFDSGDLTNPKWGGYVFTFDEGCNTGSMAYQSDKGMGADLFSIQRITTLDGVPCQGFNPNAPSDNTVATNPGDPLLLKSKKPDGKDVEIFGNRDGSGLANNLGQIKSKDTDDKEVTIQAAVDNRPEDVLDEDSGTSIGIGYSPDGFVLNTTSPDGQFSTQIQVNSSLALKEMLDARRAPKRGGPTRKGEAYAVFTPADTVGQPLPKGASDSQIEVRRCGALVSDAFVDVLVDGLPGGTRTFSAFNNGVGSYSVTYPTSAASSSAPPSNQQCGRVVEVFGQSCEDTLADLTQREVIQACLLVSDGFSPFTDASPGIAGSTFMACVRGLGAVVDYCGISGLTADDAAMGGLNPDDYVCDNVNDTVDNALDSMASNVTLTPRATLPGGRGTIIGQPQGAPAGGPFPDFVLDGQGELQISSFETIPGDPDPGEGYEARATIDCSPPGTVIEMSVSGTDGYFDSDVCTTINTGGSCSLFVPGGGQGVQDTITVSIVGGPSRTISIVF